MKLHWPLDGIGTKPGIYITQGFGENPQMYAQFNMKGHNGIDIAAPLGTPIKAAHDGYVEFKEGRDSKGNYAGYGIYARLTFEEDGLTWDVINGAHMGRTEGQSRPVKQGEIIGYVGLTGFTTGPHDHLGLRKIINGSVVDYNNGYFGYFNPLPYLINNTMQLINDKGTVYLVAGKQKKVKTGISDPEILTALFGDEIAEPGDTSSIPETQTLAKGFVIHQK